MELLGNLRFYQIAVTLVAIVMISYGTSRYLKKEVGQTLPKLFLRIGVWGGMAVVSLFPSITNRLAGLIGIEGNINAVILTGFLLIFLVIFKLMSALERLEQRLATLTRKAALEEKEEEKE